MLAGFLLRAVFAMAGLWIASRLVHGIDFASPWSLVAAALILGVLNAFVRPILFVLTLPFTLITLGLFLLVLNAAMLGLTSVFLHDFHIHGFWAAVWGSVVVSIVSWFGSMIVPMPRKGRR